ncbi:MAG: hypothetical protein Q4Q06_03285 [Bacteroidota bacterium]|nr:hypothetical protein [Bacteroidota bacterium]
MRKKNDINTKKYKQIPLSITAKDAVLLKRYCELNESSPKIVIKKVVHEFLSANVNMPEEEIKNQLSLFASRETDLFDFVKD